MLIGIYEIREKSVQMMTWRYLLIPNQIKIGMLINEKVQPWKRISDNVEKLFNELS